MPPVDMNKICLLAAIARKKIKKPFSHILPERRELGSLKYHVIASKTIPRH